jgi:hypothetical protein
MSDELRRAYLLGDSHSLYHRIALSPVLVRNLGNHTFLQQLYSTVDMLFAAMDILVYDFLLVYSTLYWSSSSLLSLVYCTKNCAPYDTPYAIT